MGLSQNSWIISRDQPNFNTTIKQRHMRKLDTIMSLLCLRSEKSVRRMRPKYSFTQSKDLLDFCVVFPMIFSRQEGKFVNYILEPKETMTLKDPFVYCGIKYYSLFSPAFFRSLSVSLCLSLSHSLSVSLSISLSVCLSLSLSLSVSLPPLLSLSFSSSLVPRWPNLLPHPLPNI